VLSTRQLGLLHVSAIGLVCMNSSHPYGNAPSPAKAHDLLIRALDLGITHFDTAALYGFGANEQFPEMVLHVIDRASPWTRTSLDSNA
jgi:aryl-alcohol dehydrogenase-like predicted oxidoreductase